MGPTGGPAADNELSVGEDEVDVPRKVRERRPKRAGYLLLTFGSGSHYCLGSHLARMILQEAVGVLLTRFPHLRLAVPADEVVWNTVSIWRYPLSLPVAW